MEKVSPHQFMTLGAAVLMGTTFLPIGSSVTGAGGRDGWMGVLPGFAIGIPFCLMVLSLHAQHPQKNLLQITEALLGKWIGKIIGCIYIGITGYFGGMLLGQCGDIFERSMMPLTPLLVFFIGGILLVFYLVGAGIEVFARFSEVVLPMVVIALVCIIGLSIPRIEHGSLLPLFSEGLKPVFFGALKVMPFVMSYILFLAGILTFLPTDNQALGLRSRVWRLVFLVGILDMMVAIIQVLVFEPVETVRLVYGLLVLGKMLELSRTISGVESIFMMIWLGAVVIKISTFVFAVIWGLKTVFNLKGATWNFVVGAVFLGISFGYVRGHVLIREIGIVDDYLVPSFTSVWILTLWAVSRKKKGASVP